MNTKKNPIKFSTIYRNIIHFQNNQISIVFSRIEFTFIELKF